MNLNRYKKYFINYNKGIRKKDHIYSDYKIPSPVVVEYTFYDRPLRYSCIMTDLYNTKLYIDYWIPIDEEQYLEIEYEYDTLIIVGYEEINKEQYEMELIYAP